MAKLLRIWASVSDSFIIKACKWYSPAACHRTDRLKTLSIDYGMERASASTISSLHSDSLQRLMNNSARAACGQRECEQIFVLQSDAEDRNVAHGEHNFITTSIHKNAIRKHTIRLHINPREMERDYNNEIIRPNVLQHQIENSAIIVCEHPIPPTAPVHKTKRNTNKIKSNWHGNLLASSTWFEMHFQNIGGCANSTLHQMEWNHEACSSNHHTTRHELFLYYVMAGG